MCGVFGVYGATDAAAYTVLGLQYLQHRGQAGAGIVTRNDEDKKSFHFHRILGRVGDGFGEEAIINRLEGTVAIGHVRYPTSGERETTLQNIQPLFAKTVFGDFALAHNGNLTNATALRQELKREGAIFQSSTDTEVIIHLLARSRKQSVVDGLIEALQKVRGAYSLVALTRDALIGARDPRGVRPLVLGQLGSALIFASETCALDVIGATFIRDILPGEIIIIDDSGMRSFFPAARTQKRFCIFEHVYFARPDSVLEGMSVYEARERIGRELARESAVEADVVVPVPDSGVPAALGYAKESGIPFQLGIIRSHYSGRMFIEPTDPIRHLGVKLKHNANRVVLSDKRVILVDDSIVRGTTMTKIVEMVRNAGALEVHVRISCPPITHSCFYGIDTPTRDELLAAYNSVEEIQRTIGADSLVFVSIDGLYRAMGEGGGRDNAHPQFCDACMTSEYLD